MSKEKPHIDSATMLRLLTAAARDEKATPEVLEKYGNMTEQECHEILLDFIQEERDLHRLCMRQADLLTGVVNAIRGKPPARTLWSHHDAPELAEKVVAELAAARKLLDDAISMVELSDSYSNTPAATFERDLRDIVQRAKELKKVKE